MGVKEEFEAAFGKRPERAFRGQCFYDARLEGAAWMAERICNEVETRKDSGGFICVDEIRTLAKELSE